MGRALGKGFVTGSRQERWRHTVAWSTWLLAAAALTLLGAIVLPVVWHAVVVVAGPIWSRVVVAAVGAARS